MAHYKYFVTIGMQNKFLSRVHFRWHFNGEQLDTDNLQSIEALILK